MCIRWESNPRTPYGSQLKRLVPHAYLGHGYKKVGEAGVEPTIYCFTDNCFTDVSLFITTVTGES